MDRRQLTAVRPRGSMTTKTANPPAYLTSAADRERWERLRCNRMLYEGEHRCYFLDEGRTQFNYPEEMIQGLRIRRYITVNLCQLMSNTTADLMFGAKAKLDAPTVNGGPRDRVSSASRKTRPTTASARCRSAAT